jgi:DNA repair photolyase
MPIIPFLTDSNDCLENLYYQAKDSGVHYVLPGTMYLRGKTTPYFFEFIKKEYPSIFIQIKNLYKNGGAGTEYKTELYKRLNLIRDKYGLTGNYSILIKEKMPKEPDLFSQL